jgi:hypothetical protein
VKSPKGGKSKVPNSKPAEGKGAPRARTRTDQDAIYLQVTKAQGDVIRAKADRENKSIKDVVLDSLMDHSELEAECSGLRDQLREFQSTMRTTQAILVGASTERALTREEAQIFTNVNKLLTRG